MRAVPTPWRSRAAAATLAVAVHGGVLVLLGLAGSVELEPMQPLRVLQTQLVSLPAAVAPAPVPPAVPEPPPVSEPVHDRQAELALKRAEQQRQRAQQRERERQRQQAELERRQRDEQLRQAAAERAEAARQAALAQAAQEGAVDDVFQPIAKRAPRYPQRALEKGIQGECTVGYTVNALGRVEHPRVVGECHPLLVQPSLSAALGFRYQPRILDGRPVAVPDVHNTFHYRIE
jgi:protein TonB